MEYRYFPHVLLSNQPIQLVQFSFLYVFEREKSEIFFHLDNVWFVVLLSK